MGIEIRFVGGPADGRIFAIPDNEPPPLYLIPVVQPIAELLTSSLEPQPTKTAEYEPLRENGWPRRADDGAYLYGYRAAPLTDDEKRALKAKRRAARTAEEERAAELDETWQAIRRERPHYPESWRDL